MTRRGLLALGAGVVSVSCGRRKRTGYDGYALVATAGESALSVVDLMTFRLLKTIKINAPPTAVVPALELGKYFVLTPSTDSVQVIDQSLSPTYARRLGEGITEIRIFPEGKALFAIAGKSRELIHADAESLRVIARYKLAGEPVGMDVSRDGDVVVSIGDQGIAELVRPANRSQRRIEFSGPLGAVRFRADGELILAARRQERLLTAVDPATLRIVTELPLAMEPQHLCFNSDQGQLFISGHGMDGVAVVFPYNTIEVEQTILAGRDPGVMAASGPGVSYLFVGSRSGTNVFILNIDTRRMIGIVDVGGKPGFITVTPDNRYVLILNSESAQVAVIYIPTLSWNREKSGASLFTEIDVGSQPVHAAVVPRIA